MRKTEKVKEYRTTFVAFVCDRCKKLVEDSDMFEFQEFKTIDGTGGYGSVLGDEQHWHVDLCQSCFAEVLGPWIYYTDDEGNRLPSLVSETE